jgi:hypothetical protein
VVTFKYTLSIYAPTIRGTPCTLPPSPYVYTSTIDKQSLLSIFPLIHIHKDMKIKLNSPEKGAGWKISERTMIC